MPSIPKLIAKGLSGAAGKTLGFHKLTLVRVEPGTRTTGSPSSGNNPTTTSYPCQGARQQKLSAFVADSMARTSQAVFSILGATLPQSVTPRAGDKIISKGVTYTIAVDGVTFDQVGAMYTCVVRAPGG